MKKNVLLAAISFLTILSPLPTIGSGAERADKPSDMWVYRGYYAWFDSGIAALETSDLEALRGAFIKSTNSLRGAKPIDAEHPLTGRVDACDVFILDDTELYFEDAELLSGGIYGFCNVNIMSGSIKTAAVSAAGGLLIAPEASLTVDGEINTGGTVECFGGKLTAVGISAGGIWLDSAEAPLDVNILDTVFTSFYTQCGGSVIIGGGLYCQVLGEPYLGSLITVNSEYAHYGETRLTVHGDVVAIGDRGCVDVGGGSGAGGYDEAALRTFESERSVHKAARRGTYESSAPATDVVIIIGGELRSAGSTVFYEGISG